MGDDPQGRLSRLEGKWVVKDKLAIGKLTTEGRVVRCPYISIQRGDFVEALVEVTVITAGPRRQVAFSLQQVVKLQEGKRERVSVKLPGNQTIYSLYSEASRKQSKLCPNASHTWL